jgi:voltage-gated potassium channel
MGKRMDERLTEMLTYLTLRRAVGLIVGVAATLSVSAAILVWLIDPGFDTFGEALWWAVSTVTTVGYGDILPVSAAGRLIGAVLMLTGLALIPMITSVVVSILISQRTRASDAQQESELEEILQRLGRIESRLGRSD